MHFQRSARIIGALLVIAIPAIVGHAWWREARTRAVVAAGVPAQPELAQWPLEFRQRVFDATRRIARGPERMAALAELSGLYHANGFSTEATQCYEALLVVEPDEPRWLHRLAHLRADAGELAAARELFERVVHLAPDYAAAQQQLREVERKLDRAHHSGATITAAEASTPVPDPWLHDVLRAAYDPYRLSVAAAVAEERRESGRAVELLERARALAPDHAPVLVQLGRLYARRGNVEEARACFQRSVQVDPKDEEAWAALTVFLAATGDLAGAERALADGLAHCPDAANLRLGNGRRLADAGRFAAAAGEFRAVVRLRPQAADARVDLARMLRQLERSDEAAAQLEAALANEPAQPDALVMLAQLAIERRDETAARAWFAEMQRQPRVPRREVEALHAEFHARFGRAP